MEISNGNNFYTIESDIILFWGLDIPIKKINISNILREFIDINDFSMKDVWKLPAIAPWEKAVQNIQPKNHCQF